MEGQEERSFHAIAFLITIIHQYFISKPNITFLVIITQLRIFNAPVFALIMFSFFSKVTKLFISLIFFAHELYTIVYKRGGNFWRNDGNVILFIQGYRKLLGVPHDKKYFKGCVGKELKSLKGILFCHIIQIFIYSLRILVVSEPLLHFLRNTNFQFEL